MISPYINLNNKKKKVKSTNQLMILFNIFNYFFKDSVSPCLTEQYYFVPSHIDLLFLALDLFICLSCSNEEYLRIDTSQILLSEYMTFFAVFILFAYFMPSFYH